MAQILPSARAPPLTVPKGLPDLREAGREVPPGWGVKRTLGSPEIFGQRRPLLQFETGKA